MTDRELRKLRRSELLEMLIAQEKENERLQQALEQAEIRRIDAQNAGSIAEAALKLNGVFEAADAAVRQYTESAERSAAEREKQAEQSLAEADRIVNAAKAEADQILLEAREVLSRARIMAEKMTGQAANGVPSGHTGE